MDFSTMSNGDLTAALASDKLSGFTNEQLGTARTIVHGRATALFSAQNPTPEQADEAEALTASLGDIDAESTKRTAAADRFASARAAFNASGVESSAEGQGETPAENQTGQADEEPGDEGEGDGDEGESGDEGEGTEGDGEGESGEGFASENPFDKGDKPKKDDEDEEKKVTTASAKAKPKPGQYTRAAGNAGPRPTSGPASADMVMTAAADVPDFSAGTKFDGLGGAKGVTQGLINKVNGFPQFSERNAHAVRSQGMTEDIRKFPVAKLHTAFDSVVTASANGNADTDQSAIAEAQKRHLSSMTAAMKADKDKQAMVAAGFCAPSEISYTYLANYVVDGIMSMPEVGAPRGGLMTTTGPELGLEYAQDGSDFGFVQTEAQAEAGTLKTLETIVCPEFEDHRLDAVGYGWTIPIMTQKFYPELITDALRLSSVLFAHKLNKRRIDDVIADSIAYDANGIGAVVNDTIEAVAVLATRERRRYNLGENAVIEVKLPQWVKVAFRLDMRRRAGLALGDVATDAKVMAEFAAYNVSVEFIADFDEFDRAGTNPPALPNEFRAIVYPAGTFVSAREDIINLQAVYDAANLVRNQYTGVFFEQADMTFRAGYRSHIVTIPLCAAGRAGALDLTCTTGPVGG